VRASGNSAPRRSIEALPDLPRRAEGEAMNARTDQIAVLYAEQARVVQRQVARRVNAPTALIEDACQTAWERLCTHPGVEPVAPSAVKWLVVTAMREAWRRASGREIPTDPTDPTDLGEPISDAPRPLERAIATEHSDELRDQLLGLSDRQRQFLALHAAGLTYAEIAERTDTTLRTVERQILRGRHKLTERG
jgi:RNA polymerase sigma factor (sigma-70 family)